MSKRKGTRNERKSMELFERMGYEVQRSAGSHGAFDFVAWSEQEFVFCQVKTNGWESPLEREAMQLVICPPNSRKLVHRWDDYARQPRVKVL